MRRFVWLEQSLHSKNKFEEFANTIQEYFDMGHAKCVPSKDMDKPCEEVVCLPMHAVTCSKASSTTSLCIVFDASAKMRSVVSQNDQLLIGATVHAPLLDVLLGFP